MASHTLAPFPAELLAAKKQIREQARSYGLDFFPVIFEMCDYEQMNQIAAYGGFPQRYPHWKFGMEYERLRKQHHYGLGRIYEMVINNDPCYAYLQESNALVDQKLVMAHVYGHCDFFKNNYWFSQTDRKMMDQMANHGNRIRRHMDRFGVEEVETFIDACLSVEDLIDIHSPFIQRFELESRFDFAGAEEEDDTPQPGRFQSKPYMESYINPPDVLAAEVVELRKKRDADKRFPSEPTLDVMLFLLEHAPLKPWQLDVLSIVRDEAYYFSPQ